MPRISLCVGVNYRSDATTLSGVSNNSAVFDRLAESNYQPKPWRVNPTRDQNLSLSKQRMRRGGLHGNNVAFIKKQDRLMVRYIHNKQRSVHRVGVKAKVGMIRT